MKSKESEVREWSTAEVRKQKKYYNEEVEKVQWKLVRTRMLTQNGVRKWREKAQ